MKTFRRQRQQYLFASVLGVIGVINLLFFVIMYRPVRSEYFQLQDSIVKTRAEVRSRRQKIDNLKGSTVSLKHCAGQAPALQHAFHSKKCRLVRNLGSSILSSSGRA